MRRRAVYTLSFLLSLFLLSCQDENPEDKAWEKAVNSNELQRYEEYVRQYPEGKYKEEAIRYIDSSYQSMLADTSQLLTVADRYMEMYPGGSLLPLIEEKVYLYAGSQGDSLLNIIYYSRFPEGKYAATVREAAAGSEEESDWQKVLAGEMDYETFLTTYPASTHKQELETLLLDSLNANPSVKLYRQLLNLFPQSSAVAALKEKEEEIYYKDLQKSMSAGSLRRFTAKFPQSSKLTEITVSTEPESVDITVSDTAGRKITSSRAPVRLLAVEGMRMVVTVNSSDYESQHDTITVEELNQNFFVKLQPSAKYLIYEEFDSPGSVWSSGGSGYTATVENGYLKLSATGQVEILKKYNIDFKRDFVLTMKVKIVKKTAPGISYAGLLWGDRYSLHYFFINIDGKTKYGLKERKSKSADNPFGYEAWTREWMSAGRFHKDDFNEMKIIKKGKKVIYSLNGLNIAAFNLMVTPKDRLIGIGLGNAEILIDKLTLKQ